MAKRGRPTNKEKMEKQKLAENSQEPVKTDEKESEITQNQPEKPEPKAKVPEKEEKKEEFLTIFEAAEHFKTTEATIKLWIEHGHLAKIRGGLIPMTSILHCRFNVRK